MKKAAYLFLPLLVFPFLTNCSNSSTYHLVTFENNGGTPHVETQKVKDGGTAYEPAPIERGHDEFLGWYSDAKFSTRYNFSEPVKNDITLYANWNPSPTTSHSFTFTGTNCSINDSKEYSTQILVNSSRQFLIEPDDGYAIPSKVTLIEGDANSFTYDSTTGIFLISKMTGDLKISAEETNSFTFKLNGTDCKINGDPSYEQTNIARGSNLQFTLLPSDNNHCLPDTIDIEEGSNVTYENGIITVSNMIDNVTISAVAPPRSREYYNVSFNCSSCKAGLNEDGSDASYNLIVTRPSKDESITLHLFPDDDFRLPNAPYVVFKDGECTSSDFNYDKDNKTLTINKKDDVLLGLTYATHMVTVDAKDGTFVSGKTLIFEVEDGTNLLNFLNFLNQPTLEGQTFANYVYEITEQVVKSGDKVDADKSIVATYSPTNISEDNL